MSFIYFLIFPWCQTCCLLWGACWPLALLPSQRSIISVIINMIISINITLSFKPSSSLSINTLQRPVLLDYFKIASTIFSTLQWFYAESLINIVGISILERLLSPPWSPWSPWSPWPPWSPRTSSGVWRHWRSRLFGEVHPRYKFRWWLIITSVQCKP